MTTDNVLVQATTQPKVRETGADRLFNIVNYTLLIAILLAVLYPLIYVVSASVSDPIAVLTGQVWLLPVDFSLLAYDAIFKYEQIWVGFMNSIFYMVVGSVVSVTMTILAAYPLSRRDLYGKNLIMFLFVFTIFFSGGLIPTYLTVKQVGLLNTRWALIIPTAMTVFNMIIAVTYFRTSLPQELLDAAQLDGCNDIQYLIRIVLPLSKPIIAVLFLFYAINQWNEFFNALLYISSKDLQPLQIVLREILVQNNMDWNMLQDVETAAKKEALRELLKFALIVVASVPVLLIYPFVQKYFVKGIMIGSIKG